MIHKSVNRLGLPNNPVDRLIRATVKYVELLN
jgi:histone H3/H4